MRPDRFPVDTALDKNLIMTDVIANNLHRVQDRIANAAIAAGRNPEDITLVAVSKTKPVEAVAAALDAGQAVFGENRVQEAAANFRRCAHGIR